MNVLIAGGGIGGLACARALTRAGHAVTLVERAPAFEAIGAGLTFAPNAVKGLARLGVDLRPVGRAVGAMEIHGAHSGLLQRVDLSTLTAAHGPLLALTRPAVHHALLEGLAGTVELVLDAPLAGLTQSPDGVEVDLGHRGRRRVDVVIGADGLHSAVRTALVGRWPLRSSGQTCWRLVAPLEQGDAAREVWGGRARAGLVPLRDGQTYVFLVLTAPPRGPDLAWPEGFVEAFGHLPWVGDVLAALDGPPALHHDLLELERPVWGQRRVLLLGDAAHAMTPNLGQGAAMAIEDALAVARVLADGVGGAVERYRALRHARVRRVQLDARRLGQVAHWTGALPTALRDRLLRAMSPESGVRRLEGLIAPGLELAA